MCSEYGIEFEEDMYDPGVWQLLKNSIPGNKTLIEVDLSPGVNYRFKMFARNRVGWSVNATNPTTRVKTPDAGK